MKKISKLKIGQLNKANLEEREMNRLYGGNYCAWGPENAQANAGSGKCSCACSGDYYGSHGLEYLAPFFKYSTSW